MYKLLNQIQKATKGARLMDTIKCNRFKGEIENYLRNGQKHFDSKINDAFNSLKFKTWLSRCNIIKKDGYPASHLLFILFLLPVLKLKTEQLLQ